jgi:ATP-dependent DNA helicase RecQ
LAIRTYAGIYDTQTAFNLQLIAKKSKHTETQVLAVLQNKRKKTLLIINQKNNDASLVLRNSEDERTMEFLYLETRIN